MSDGGESKNAAGAGSANTNQFDVVNTAVSKLQPWAILFLLLFVAIYFVFELISDKRKEAIDQLMTTYESMQKISQRQLEHLTNVLDKREELDKKLQNENSELEQLRKDKDKTQRDLEQERSDLKKERQNAQSALAELKKQREIHAASAQEIAASAQEIKEKSKELEEKEAQAKKEKVAVEDRTRALSKQIEAMRKQLFALARVARDAMSEQELSDNYDCEIVVSSSKKPDSAKTWDQEDCLRESAQRILEDDIQEPIIKIAAYARKPTKENFSGLYSLVGKSRKTLEAILHQLKNDGVFDRWVSYQFPAEKGTELIYLPMKTVTEDRITNTFIIVVEGDLVKDVEEPAEFIMAMIVPDFDDWSKKLAKILISKSFQQAFDLFGDVKVSPNNTWSLGEFFGDELGDGQKLVIVGLDPSLQIASGETILQRHADLVKRAAVQAGREASRFMMAVRAAAFAKAEIPGSKSLPRDLSKALHKFLTTIITKGSEAGIPLVSDTQEFVNLGSLAALALRKEFGISEHTIISKSGGDIYAAIVAEYKTRERDGDTERIYLRFLRKESSADWRFVRHGVRPVGADLQSLALPEIDRVIQKK